MPDMSTPIRAHVAVVIGKHLRRARAKAKITQARLASRIGQSSSTIAAYEAGAVTPPGDVLLRLTVALRLRLRPLLRAVARRGHWRRRAAA